MKLMCISNETSNWCHLLDGISWPRLKLTPGKVYEGNTDTHGNYVVVNDIGIKNVYSTKTLIPLDEWRKEKLKEIGI